MAQSEKVLASIDGLGLIHECACGTIRVSVGPVELKFTQESFRQTFEMFRDAVGRLDTHSDTDDSAQIEEIALEALRSQHN